MTTLIGWLGTLGGAGAALAVAWLMPPLRKHALIAALGIAFAGGAYLKIRHDAQADIIARIEQEKADAIDKALAAREHIRDLCQRDAAGCVPDDWFRD